MTFTALLYAYVFGGLTFIPLVIAGVIFFTIYTSVPVGGSDRDKERKEIKAEVAGQNDEHHDTEEKNESSDDEELTVDDIPKTRRGWLTMRRTFEESNFDSSYVTLMRSFLDARSKDPKRSRPKDTWYVVLKGTVLYLYEDESMTECEAALEVAGHDVFIYPEGLPDGELFAKRNAICLRPKVSPSGKNTPSSTRSSKMLEENGEQKLDEIGGNGKRRTKEMIEGEKRRSTLKEEGFNPPIPWFIFVRSNIEMEDWYLSLVHASDHPANSPTLAPLKTVFQPSDMAYLVSTLDSQPDVIPMRWLNAMIGRIFFSCYRTQALEDEIIRRLMRKLSKVKRPAFLTDIIVTEVAVGDKAPTFSKPMLKELTKEGDAALEVHLQYKGEVRITVEATATINLGARFKSYVVKLTLAVVLREIEGNLLIKVKRPPSNRIWYAFTQTPKMVLDVEPIVSDRQITWSMILNSIEARLKEIIQESVVMPFMDDIAFFETSSYHHRGGIWSDASRRERIPVVTETIGGLASTSDLGVSITTSTNEAESARFERTPSTDELRPSFPSSPTPESTSSTSLANATPSDDSPRPRTRSWFSGSGSNDAAALILAPGSDEPPDSDSKRGRSIEVEVTTSGRSQSTPNSPSETVHRHENNDDGDRQSTYEENLLLSNSRRSSWQHSLPSSLRERLETLSTSSSDLIVPSPARESDASRGGSQVSGSSSFLSTLKSRAGDKQALSNSAKEAMRKLGVSWGGLRKDVGAMNDDVPDYGSVDSRRRVESNSSLSQRARASYAEVRAAVAERRGKDKGPQRGENGRLSPTPDTGKGKERAGYFSSLGSSPPISGIVTAPSTPATRPRSDSSESSNALPNDFSPPVSRTVTEQASNYGSEGKELAVMNAGGPPSPSPPTLIYTQPMQAKAMSIPSIHASHRGDVMSLGYVAPAPLPESKPRNPAIQSVYRLWRSPILTGEHRTGGDPSQSQSQHDTTDGNKDVTPLSLSPSIQSAPSTPSRPPPLPPRSTPTSISRPEVDDPRLSPEAPLSAASDALKSIATNDENKRASLERNSPTSPTRRDSVPSVDADPKSQLVSADNEDSSRAGSLITSPSNIAPPLPPRRLQSAR